MSACGNEKQTTDLKTQNEISIKEETQESRESIDLWEPSDMGKSSKQNILNFTTGLQIVLPESWNDKIIIEIEPGTEEYALILELPREMNYVEGREEMQEAYEELSDFVDEVQIKTDHMIGFTRCEIDDVGWIKYE